MYPVPPPKLHLGPGENNFQKSTDSDLDGKAYDMKWCLLIANRSCSYTAILPGISWHIPAHKPFEATSNKPLMHSMPIMCSHTYPRRPQNGQRRRRHGRIARNVFTQKTKENCRFCTPKKKSKRATNLQIDPFFEKPNNAQETQERWRYGINSRWPVWDFQNKIMSLFLLLKKNIKKPKT